jgi:hypothetical protein
MSKEIPKEISQNERNKMIVYINDNIQELKLNFRKEILQIILCSNINHSKVLEKGSGTQIKFIDIDDSLLKIIYNNIFNKIEKAPELEL